MTDVITDPGADAPADIAPDEAAVAAAAALAADPAPTTYVPAADDPPAPKKGSWAQKRIDELTGEKYDEKRAREAAEARADAAEALLRGTGKVDPPAAAAPADGERRYTQAEVEATAAQIAAARNFNERCDTLFEAAAAKHTDFPDAVKTLNQAGVMSVPFVEAAMATDAPADVLHHLGQDPEEAQRISKLPPARMGVELAKLAAKLSAPKAAAAISGAPDPIKPLGGAAKPELDIYDSTLSDADYYSRRKAMGAPYIR